MMSAKAKKRVEAKVKAKAAKEAAATKKKNMQKEVKKEILKFYVVNNLHVLVTDMINKAFLEKSNNPILFMAEYLLQTNNISLESFLQSKAENLSSSDEQNATSSPSDLSSDSD